MSSGRPPAAIAVLRVSGRDAFAVVEALAGSLPPARMAKLRSLRAPDGSLLDQAIIVVFPGPLTATGEDLVELHLHGGPAVVRAVEAALAADPRTRAAEAGEFTRRALLHGRIDLTQAEGLADLLAAETEAQRRVAIQASGGALRRSIDGIGTRILLLSARAEALLDFADEDDVGGAGDEAGQIASLQRDIQDVAVTVSALVARPTVDRLRDGFRVVLAGPPNSGKSTLVNAMAEREISIVSDIAGTTRDRIEAFVAVGGFPILLTDTAGLATETTDTVERIGIERAHAALDEADVILWLGDAAVPPVYANRALALHPRCDAEGRGDTPADRIGISALHRIGFDSLWEAVIDCIATLAPPGDAVAVNQRQHALLAVTLGALTSATGESELLLIAERLREARLGIDRITGRADVESMLDQLFGRFCIGK